MEYFKFKISLRRINPVLLTFQNIYFSIFYLFATQSSSIHFWSGNTKENQKPEKYRMRWAAPWGGKMQQNSHFSFFQKLLSSFHFMMNIQQRESWGNLLKQVTEHRSLQLTKTWNGTKFGGMVVRLLALLYCGIS